MTQTTFHVPEQIDATRWEQIEPLYQALLDRPLHCVNCLEQLLLDRSQLDSAVDEAGADLYIRMTCNTSDPDRKQAYLDYVEQVVPKLRQVSFELDRKIVEAPMANELDSKYDVMLRDLRADVEIFRPENLPLRTEDTKLGQQYDELCGEMMVTFQGKERTLPQMARYLQDTDRNMREQAWRIVAERRYRDAERINDIYDRMIELRHAIAQHAGFENYRDYTFVARRRFDYTPEDCASFHQAVEEVCVPVCRTLNEERASLLDLDDLRPWDLDVDVRGRSALRPFATADELVDRTSKLFHRMEPSLGSLFDTLRQGDCLDLDTRKGKAPGGYQYWRDRSRRPFIFMNAAGLQRDLNTMVHEVGHAFHSLLSQDQPIRHFRDCPIEFCEVASMSMELTSHPYFDEFYNDEDANRARRDHLEQLTTRLAWIATIDAFQHWVYLNPGHTREERTAQWLALNERFGPTLDWNGIEHFLHTSWQRQLHLFGVPFYYIEYGIAQLGALQLWVNYRRDPKRAIDRYRAALSLGGSRPLPELFEAAELTFDFSSSTMSGLMNEVRSELDQLPA